MLNPRQIFTAKQHTMFSLTRRRREGERNKKLEELFREADVAGKGMINKEQLIKLFAVAEVQCKYT